MYTYPFKTVYDAAVFGGGLCGVSAALNLAGRGRKVILVERRPQPGWEVTSAFECVFGESSCRTAVKIKKRLKSMGGCKGNTVSPPVAEIFLNRLLEEEGIELLLFSYPLYLAKKGGLACGIVTGSKNGTGVIRARIFVDATEEAFLWRQAGTGFKKNIPDSHSCRVFFNGLKKGPGRYHAPGRKGIPGVDISPSVWPGECCVSFDASSGSISGARLKLPEVIALLRENVPVLRDAFVTHAGCETFASDTPYSLEEESIRHPDIKNLFASGLWIFSDGKKRRGVNSVSGRIETGEKAGKHAKDSLKDFKKYVPGSPGDFQIPFPRRKVSADIVIAGAGTAGAVAGIASSGRGVKTLILEAGTAAGGMGTGGSVHSYYHGVAGGLQDEINKRVDELSPLFCGGYGVRGYHPEARKVVLEEMFREAGLDVLYSTVATGVRVADRKVREVLAVTPFERISCPGEVFVDSTGDGDIAAAAGVAFNAGRDIDGLSHSYSQSAGWFDGKNRFYRGANFDAGYVDSLDTADLTRARRRGVAHFYRDKYSADNRPLYISPMLGVRQGRNIKGKYLLTFRDALYGRRFPDTVSFMRAHYDNHSFRYLDVANQGDDVILWTLLLGNFLKHAGCEVPYRCLLPEGIEGLIVACRAISADDEAQFIFRMQRDMQRIGEAAGVAAFLSVNGKTVPEKIDIVLLQKELKKTGLLDKRLRPEPAVKDYPFNRLKEIFLSEKPGEALWALSFDKRAVPFLMEVLEKGSGAQRFYAAVALSMHGKKEGVPQLVKALSEKNATLPEGLFTVPFWKSAIVFLGRAGDERAVDALLGVLGERGVSTDVILTVVRALGRIGSRKAVPGLLELLERKDISTGRKFNGGGYGFDVSGEDILWQVQLSAAEVLKKLGSPRDGAVKKYLDDPRSYVRSYAEKILREKSNAAV